MRKVVLQLVALLMLGGLAFSTTNVTGCQALNNATDTSYILVNNVVGANISATPDTGNACIMINTANIVFDCNGFNITNNVSGTTYGIMLKGVVNITVKNCPGVSNYTYGIYSNQSNRSRFINNTVRNNTDGVTLIRSSTDNNLTNNTIFNNTRYGVNVNNSNRTLLSADHFYNNGIDLFTNYTVRSVFNLSYVIFDSSLGNYTNYTNISVNETTAATANSYGFDWAGQPAALPPSRDSFAGKFINISYLLSGFANLDKVVWHWLNSELNGSNNDSMFMLYNYNSSNSTWLTLNTTPDASSNTLSLSAFNANGVYAILENVSIPPISCPVYSSPGVYQLNQSYSGASNSVSEISPGALACIKIASSDVIFDCNGFNITNDGTLGTTMGIALNGSLTNVTIRNCQGIGGYTDGIYVYDSNNGIFTNNTLYNNSNYGITIDFNSNGNVITNNTAYSNFYGIGLYSNSNGNVINNTAYGNSVGIDIFASSSNNITNNTLYNNSYYGISLGSSSDGNAITNNTAYSNGYGIILYSSSSNNITNNTLYNNSNSGIYLGSSPSNNLINNTVSGSTYEGVHLSDSNQTQIAGDHLYGNNPDLRLESDYYGPFDVMLFGVVFDNPAGGFQNFTNLSINDTLGAGEIYDIFWSQNVSGLPDNYTSFGNKFVNITPVSGSPSIDTLVWSWLDAELGGYNESRFVIFRYNGAWSALPSSLDTGANTLTLSNLNSFSQFGPLENGSEEINITGQQVELFGVNVTSQDLPRWEGSSYAGNVSTSPGNLTMANISAAMLTDRWAAFYGNISSAEIILGDSTSALVYSWLWDGNGSIICVSTNGSVHTFEAFPGLRSNVDNAWGFDPAASDSANNTFTGTNCTLEFGATSISDMDYADTGYPGGFQTCLLKMAPTPIKDQVLFCTMAESNSTLWNDETGDFELLVPTPYGPGASGFETYYFYMAAPG